MVDDKTVVKVTNRSSWRIPDMGNLTRSFMPGETKPVSAEEIRKLNWTPGGAVMLRDDLVLDNAELIEELLGEVEPEYNYDEAKVKDILMNGSMDEFMDTLDFAPEGIIDMMKDLAISLEIPDVRKREALSKKTGVNINNAININNISGEEEGEKPAEKKQRRVAAAAQESSTPAQRRTTPPAAGPKKYNVIIIKMCIRMR